jgi:molybdopterin-guanine dinucleotide biosynthesis protein A
MTTHHRTVGLILAGGRSRRMLGQDKTLLGLQGDTLLTHVIRCLRPQVDALALNSNAEPDTFAGYALPVMPDRLPGFLGPLAGIHAGLLQYPEDYLVTVAVDLPFLPPNLVSRLRAGLGTKPCAHASDSERHALALLWHPGTAAIVEAFLQRGGRSLKEFLAIHGQAVHFNQLRDRGLFCNINTPEELARAELDAERFVSASAADEQSRCR